MVFGLILSGAGVVMADAIDDEVKIIETQPAGMDKPTWKDKRREAARKLGQSKDKRAVAELIKVAEAETFDAIGVIAIEGLGNQGDPSAVPVLQRIVGDTKRDPDQVTAAKKALDKIGAPEPTPETPPDKPPPPDKPVTTVKVVTPDKPAATVEIPSAPDLADDTIAAYERLTLAGGTASLGYDTVRKRANIQGDVAALYQRWVDRPTFAWGMDAGAHVVAGAVNPDGAAVSRGAVAVANVDGEARAYRGGVYGLGRTALSAQVNYVSDTGGDGNTIVKDTALQADLEVAIGVGYGRVVDAGAAVRVRRLARALEANKALGKPIDATLQKKLELTWWSLRKERTTYKALLATVALLREAGILLVDPDAGLTYEILNVLRDSQLFQRPVGFDINVAIGEGYLRRPDEIMQASFENGRIEQAIVKMGYGAQLDDDKLEVSATGFARKRLFTDDNTPSPYAIGGGFRVRRFTYGEHGDPQGALDFTVDAALSDDDLMTDTNLRVTGALGYTWWLNPVSAVKVAATATLDTGEVFLGAQLSATYGFLDGTFAR